MSLKGKDANPMWGGRFQCRPAEVMQKMNASIAYDRRLALQDIMGSRAHCQMLVDCGIIPAADGEAILAGLTQVENELLAGTFPFNEELEDIHMNIESRLAQIIGEPAGKLHTARSRNDQVATDFRIWVRSSIEDMDREIDELQVSLLNRAEEYHKAIMPGFTHFQPAQPITLGHHLLAYCEMLDRDRSRLHDARERMNECPLGAAALAGTTFPINRDQTAKTLGFRAPTRNSLDSVSDRDFALEFLSAAAICASHLSRLAEELVIWSSPQFGFIRLSDAFSTGSSIMPQKRNPDGAELVRAKTGRISGHLTALLMVMKGLPLGYNKDTQEDKEAVFDASDSLLQCIAAMRGMIADMQVNTDKMRKAAEAGFPEATDLADWLVREKGLPFRLAHGISARIVQMAENKGCKLGELSLSEMQTIEPKLDDSLLPLLQIEECVARRKNYGGTAPEQVIARINEFRKRLKER